LLSLIFLTPPGLENGTITLPQSRGQSPRLGVEIVAWIEHIWAAQLALAGVSKPHRSAHSEFHGTSMIISHSRKFILVKSMKTASTSLERAIIPQLSREDIWTPLSLPKMKGQNYYSLWPPDWLTARWGRYRDWVGKESQLHYRYFFDHISIQRIASMMPASTFENYTKFCFDRNPWDFLVSSYFFERRKGKVVNWDFDQFLYEFSIVQNWELYTKDNTVIVDRVFRFEDLPSAIQEIQNVTGLSIDTLPNYKRSYRKDNDYRSFYSQSSRDYVAEKWKRTIELLHYDF
jgi:hypothetical protein